MHESTTADFKEYNPKYKKEQSDIEHLLGFKCKVIVINDENVNVVCPPDGKIIVFTELKNFATVEEIGTVIDHEDKNGSKQSVPLARKIRSFKDADFKGTKSSIRKAECKNYMRRYEGKKEDNDVESRQKNGGVVGQSRTSLYGLKRK
ncbi:hypothetical protein Tco_0895484 [Tanacetum coccineum]|uniref:Uncharacterized protein n=1 Tax=Tanacetum coccineum TaxID=301880 RepID=A0ABQ5CHL0_9ASTR